MRKENDCDYIKKEKERQQAFILLQWRTSGLVFIDSRAFLSYSNGYKTTTAASFTGVCKLLQHVCEFLRG